MSLFFVFIILVTWIFSRALGNPSILYGGVIFALVMNIFSYWNSDKVVIKMSGAKPIDKATHRELFNIVENLTIATGLPMPKLYIINDHAPNAFATGRDPEHSAIAVTSGLLERLDRSELEGVLAHELSHIKNRDILVSTIAVVLVGFIAIVSDMFLRHMFFFGNNNDRERGGDARLQLIFFVVGIIMAILAPIAASLIQLAISRKREYLADASGALMTRYPDGLANALRKISSYQGELKKASHATAHLYIANPFREKGFRKALGQFFMTHPPIEERIKALEDMGK
ncbi:M48 family metallopeptidase [Candidatus Azambacteria bacterium]|nr:M48 family metallopeptidase [Candidatus Azambacteria bacterium]